MEHRWARCKQFSFAYVFHCVDYLSSPCDIFYCLVVNCLYNLNVVAFRFRNSDLWMVVRIRPLLMWFTCCISIMWKTVVNQGPTGFLTDSGLIRFTREMTLILRDLDNRI